ncbi:MAG: AbrB/MazE/SpoVT family DNA-binding domain-containing protein [Anaerolineales bacterium]|nr:AbrB/MazE/SpoVT family DNA-binding domain-containing protein [Anaerolineales bacterium]
MDALTTISSKYQIVIPRSIREQFHLKPGQKLMFIPLNKTIKIVVVPSIEEAQGMFPGIDTNVEREAEDRV